MLLATLRHARLQKRGAAMMPAGGGRQDHQSKREAHGMRNELSLRLKWFHRSVPCARVFLTPGQNERCESSSSHQGPAHAPRPRLSLV